MSNYTNLYFHNNSLLKIELRVTFILTAAALIGDSQVYLVQTTNVKRCLIVLTLENFRKLTIITLNK